MRVEFRLKFRLDIDVERAQQAHDTAIKRDGHDEVEDMRFAQMGTQRVVGLIRQIEIIGHLARAAQHGAVEFRQAAILARRFFLHCFDIVIGDTEVAPEPKVMAVLVWAFRQVTDLQYRHFPRK